MRFFKFLRFDLVNGSRQTWKPFVGGLLLFLFAAIDFLKKIGEYRTFVSQIEGAAAVEFTLGEMALFLFGGMKRYIPSAENPFLFPALWLLFFVILFFSTLYYPFEDLGGFGQQILLYSGRRKGWWLSKVIWNMATVTCYFALAWLVLILFSFAAGGQMSFKITNVIFGILELEFRGTEPESWKLGAQLVFAPWLVAMAVSLVQMLLSLLIQPVFSLIVSASYMIASAYFCSPFLLGNYAMVVRDTQIMEAGMDFTTGVLFSLTVIALSIVGGIILFRRYDILVKE